MRIFFDENIGRGVPEALRLIGFGDVDYVINMFADQHAAQGVSDEFWIPQIGSHRLVISKDQQLLKRPAQIELLARYRVGLICITSPTATSQKLLEFMLRRMNRLEEIDREMNRPLAFRVALHGRFTRIDLPAVI